MRSMKFSPRHIRARARTPFAVLCFYSQWIKCARCRGTFIYSTDQYQIGFARIQSTNDRTRKWECAHWNQHQNRICNADQWQNQPNRVHEKSIRKRNHEAQVGNCNFTYTLQLIALELVFDLRLVGFKMGITKYVLLFSGLCCSLPFMGSRYRCYCRVDTLVTLWWWERKRRISELHC